MPSYLRFALFFLVLLGALGGINAFVFKRLRDLWGLEKRGRRVLVAVLVGGLLALVGSRILGRWEPSTAVTALGLVGAAVQLGAIVTFAVLVVERAIALLWRGLGRVVAAFENGAALAQPAAAVPSGPAGESLVEQEPASEPAAAPDSESPAGLGSVAIGRRALIGRTVGAAAVGLGGAPAIYGALFGRHDYTIEEVPVRLPDLPPALDGFTLVQLSDVHLGIFVGERELRSMMEMVRRARPDAIVLTGDLIDHDPRYVEMLGSMARRLGEQAPVIAVPGNHDYYAGIGATNGALRRAGAKVLVNQAERIGEGRIALVGVDDLWARRFGRGGGPDVQKAVRGLPREIPRVLLCHNPAYFPEASPHVDLQLSGHTHGGQYNPGGLRPADLVLPYGYVAGRYERDGAQLWVNRGFGTAGPPARVGSPPEITRVVLTA